MSPYEILDIKEKEAASSIKAAFLA